MDAPARLAAALHAVHLEHLCRLHRQTPGARVARVGGVVLADSGTGDDTVNTLCADGPVSDPRPALAAARRTGRPFVWWADPSGPDGLAGALGAAGFPVTATATAMAAIGPPADADPGDLRIEIVRDRIGLRDWAGVLASAWDPPATELSGFLERAAPVVLADPALTLLVGYAGDRAVATARVLVHAGVAGLFDVVTREGYRRHGAGTAMSARAMLVAARAASRATVLTAADDAARLYTRLGFRAFGQVTEHAVRP